MKRILALLLAIIMIFTLAACGKETADNTDTGTTTNTESSTTGTEETTGSTENPDETTSSTEGTEESTTTTEDPQATEGTEKPTEGTKPTEKPTEQTKPTEPTKPTESSHKHSYNGKVTKNATCTEKGTKTFTCSCGSYYTESISATGHSFGEWKTTKEPTTTAEGNSQRKCSSCGATENKSIPKKSSTTSAYYVGYKEVKKEYAYQTFVDGKHIVERLHNNKTVQTGDKITIQVEISDGGSDFKIDRTFGGKIEKNGNKVVMTADGSGSEVGFWLEVKNANGQTEQKLISYSVLQYDFDIIQSQTGAMIEIRDYAQRHGISFRNGIELKGYTADDKNKSLTGNKVEGNDDYIPIKSSTANGKYVFQNTDWFSEVLNLIEQYEKMNFTKWFFQLIYPDGFATIVE